MQDVSSQHDLIVPANAVSLHRNTGEESEDDTLSLVDPQYHASWEPAMAVKILEQAQRQTSSKPFLVGIVGIPGSGKTVSSILLANELKKLNCHAMIMPHDGYHYPLSYLRDCSYDPDDMIYRRGAPDTFDAASLRRDLDRIRDGKESNKELLLFFPGFDHSKGDPEPNRHLLDRTFHDVVICEGLYLLHDADGWEGIAEYWDCTIFIESNIDVCIERLKVRNLCIPGYTAEEIAIRCEQVDRVNANIVLQGQHRAHYIVQNYIESATAATAGATTMATTSIPVTETV